MWRGGQVPPYAEPGFVAGVDYAGDCRALVVAGSGSIEALKNDVEVVGDFGCEAAHAGNRAQAQEACDQRVLDEVLAAVVGGKASHCRTRGLDWGGAGSCARSWN